MQSSWEASLAEAVAHPDLAPPAAAVLPIVERQRNEGAPPQAIVLRVPVWPVLLETRPRFAWDAPADPGPFRVEVYDAAFREVAASPPLDERAWVPERPLPAGVNLAWQVVSLRGDERVAFPRPPVPPAVFRIARPSVVVQVKAARRSGSRLVARLVLWRAGLLQEAAEEFAAVAAANPGSRLARRLASSIAREARQMSYQPAPTTPNAAQ